MLGGKRASLSDFTPCQIVEIHPLLAWPKRGKRRSGRAPKSRLVACLSVLLTQFQQHGSR